MKFWFVHSGEVSLREQLVAQVHLGIASGDLKPGERLPSTRAMAQRYGLHANTVSVAYRELETLGRVEMRKGSGVYIRDIAVTSDALGPRERLDAMVQMFAKSVRAAGHTEDQVREALQRWLALPVMKKLVLVEPDADLQQIVLTELEEAGVSDVTACGWDDALTLSEGAVMLALPSKMQRLREMVPAGDVRALQIRSVPQSLLKQGTIPRDALVGIASRWKEFLRLAETMLLAAGVPAECLVVRDTSQSEWQAGLEVTAAVVCDVVTCALLPREVHVVPFRLLAAESLDGLK